MIKICRILLMADKNVHIFKIINRPQNIIIELIKEKKEGREGGKGRKEGGERKEGRGKEGGKEGKKNITIVPCKLNKM